MQRILRYETAFALTALTVLSLFAFSVAQAQSPTGRPRGGRSRRHKVEPKPPAPPEKLTYLLTVITDPPGCEVVVNGVAKGASNTDGKLKIDKLDEGTYKVDVSKDGYVAASKQFKTGADTPTLVFKLIVSLDDQIKQFDSLVVAGKLIGPGAPNAFDFLQGLAAKYPGRAEVTKSRAVLLQKLVQSAQVVADETERWREIKRKRIEQGHDAAAAAVSLAPDDKDAARLNVYLSASLALRDWETGTPATADDKLLVAAASGFEKVAGTDAKSAFVWYQLGRCRLLSNDWAGAQTAFSKCVALNGGLIDAYLGIAAAYYGMGNYRESISEYQKIISLDNNNSAAYSGMGLARAALGKTKDGIKDIERASQLKPDSGIPHLSLGMIYSKSKKKKDRETALAELRAAIQKNPTGLEFPNRIAQGLVMEVDSEKK